VNETLAEKHGEDHTVAKEGPSALCAQLSAGLQKNQFLLSADI
jgi:hypothetical protein